MLCVRSSYANIYELYFESLDNCIYAFAAMETKIRRKAPGNCWSRIDCLYGGGGYVLHQGCNMFVERNIPESIQNNLLNIFLFKFVIFILKISRSEMDVVSVKYYSNTLSMTHQESVLYYW